MTTEAVTIRDIRPDDFSTIATWLPAIPLWQRYGVTYTTAMQWFTAPSFQEHSVYVADIDQADGQACGMVWCIPDGAFGRSAYIRLLGIHNDFTGRGIGGQLLTAAEGRAASYTSDMFLLVSDFNVDAQRFYQRHGYDQIGGIQAYVLPDVAELIYHKKLISSE